VLPYTIGHYLASEKLPAVSSDDAEFKGAEEQVNSRINTLLGINGKRSADSFHRELGKLLWEKCGMGRNREGLRQALQKIPALREEFWQNLKVPGEGEELNMALEQAGRVADFIDFGELMCRDALQREESCGGHFREEYQTEEGEARRNDHEYAYVGAWEYRGPGNEPQLNKEPLVFEEVKLATRSYK
jgi:succinate dehydrogenase / fumarate reductase flavoprotein subunit